MAGTTTVQRKTLVGALVLAAALGAGGVALVSNVDGDGATRISDVETTTTEAETTTSEATTSTEAPTTTAAPTTEAPLTTMAPTTTVVVVQQVPLEEKVAEHEQRITDLEEVVTTTTTAAPAKTVVTACPPVTPDACG
jgi:hypothetical protein